MVEEYESYNSSSEKILITENRISYEYTSYVESKRKVKDGEAMWGVYKSVRVGVIKPMDK